MLLHGRFCKVVEEHWMQLKKGCMFPKQTLKIKPLDTVAFLIAMVGLPWMHVLWTSMEMQVL
ncbi:hypothetical protein D3C87_2168770 [compost metagenome]